MNIEFKEFPVSYRYSQGGIAFAMLCLFFARSVFSPKMPLILKTVFGATLGLVVASSLIASCYVVIKYPYLSLVEPAEGDHFDKYFGSSGTWIFTSIRLLALVVIVVLIGSLFTAGIDDIRECLLLVYLLIMFGFLIFLTFFYDPVAHPTIATYTRATLGIGVLLFPFFAPILMIGSFRCRQLLDEFSDHTRFGE